MAAHGGRAGEKGGSAGGDGGASATLATLHRMSSSGGAPRAEGRAPVARDLGARGGAPGPPAWLLLCRCSSLNVCSYCCSERVSMMRIHARDGKARSAVAGEWWRVAQPTIASGGGRVRL